MNSPQTPRSGDMRRQAIVALFVATVLWGVSFVTLRAIGLVQRGLAPGADSMLLATATVAVRYAVSALVLLAVWRGRGGFTRGEIAQGVVLGAFHGLGLLFQTDGLAHTDASVSAFLTQTYCVFLPLWVACRQRRLPDVRIAAAVVLVMAGITLLARVDWQHLRPGRGELETLLSSVFFTGQILWLEKPAYRDNRPMQITVVMVATVAVLLFPLAAVRAPDAAFLVRLFAPPPVWLLMAVLVVFSTVAASLLMNRWQRHVTATEAGLIYGSEPVYATAFALFLPEAFSRLSGIAYDNEQVTTGLFAGGALMFAAIALSQWRRA